MLFNSYAFIFAFFPLAALGWFWVGRAGIPQLTMLWILADSLFFYGWWDPRYVPVLAASIGINFVLGRGIARLLGRSRRGATALLAGGVAINLLALGAFKYTAFVAQNLNAGLGIHLDVPAIVLPLAISFFTFQQISFLVDVYRGHAPRGLANPVEYAALVTFFPHLIAGPIVLYRELAPQFEDPARARFAYENLAIGSTVFFAGLFKKTAIADTLAPVADTVFHGAASTVPAATEAWVGLLSYTLQIYFDFSGYSDMAIGAALILGVRLPVNFDSPYRATSIIEFWRRWHITLSRFLREYVYFPLGGNRRGEVRQSVNLMITMLLAGLWHGAGWNFIIWGGLHGLYIAIDHRWQRTFVARWPAVAGTSVYRSASWLLTLAAVIFAWIFFRSEGLHAAVNLMHGLAGAGTNEVAAPPYSTRVLALIAAGAMLVLFCPNIYQIIGDARDFGVPKPGGAVAAVFAWRPSRVWALGSAIIATVAVVYISRTSEFVYFQF